MLRYLTAGESHGKALTTIIEGVPANLHIENSFINRELSRRQAGYGRGGRMKIESDAAQILSGVRHGKTIGSPVTLLIENKDWENWHEAMSAECGVLNAESTPNSVPVTRPRPGHADLSGAIKYNQRDVRNILERSSARETAARVAAGAVAKSFLQEFGINVYSWVAEIGGIKAAGEGQRTKGSVAGPSSVYYAARIAHKTSLDDLFNMAERSDVRCPDREAAEAMKRRIDEAKANGDSVGGVFEIVISGVPVGLGSHVQFDRKLDAALAGAIMGIQAIKGVEVGLGFEEARRFGSEIHDEIFYENSGFYRKTNNAGGIEGGMSNGEDIVLRAVMKPIPTLYKPLRSVDIETKESFEASIERSDICAVPAAAVIGEAVAAFEIAKAFIEKFSGDSMEEVKRNYEGYQDYVRGF